MNIPLCQLILKMCFADSFVTIQLDDKMIQYINEQNITWTPNLITLDRGLDTLRRTKPLNDIIKNFKNSNNSKLSFYEKILTFFDPGYLSAKRFFGDNAFGFTIRHSKTFRKRIISLMVILFFGIPFSFFYKNYF